MRAFAFLGLIASVSVPWGEAPSVSSSMEPVVDVGPDIVRREYTASESGAGRVWVRAVRDLVEDRLDVDALTPDAPVTVWTLGDDVVAFAVDGRFAARARGTGEGERWVFDDGSSLDGPVLSRPVRYLAVASRIGVRQHPVTHQIKFHAGTDYAAPVGTPVHVAADGVVTEWLRSWTAGKVLVVRHDDGSESKYMHLDDKVAGIDKGVRVHQGQLIAFVGKTGRVTGPHLHFEWRDRYRTPLDPIVARWPAAGHVDDASLAALRVRRELLATWRADGTRDLESPWIATPSAVTCAQPADGVRPLLVPPLAPMRRSDVRARGTAHSRRRRRFRAMQPLFDDATLGLADALIQRAVTLSLEFPDDPILA